MNHDTDTSSQNIALVEPIGPGPSPFLPRNLIRLFSRPSEFFRSDVSLSHKPNVILVTWCLGIAAALDRVDSSISKADFGRPRPGWETLGPWLTDSWLALWLWLLLGGAIAGLLYWWLGGWWFRLRVRWCGDGHPDRKRARLVMVYSAFVHSGPVVLMLMVQTLAYPNYGVAYASDPVAPVVALVFAFWSVGTSYVGVISTFSVGLWKARTWFLVLPILFYVGIFGIVAVLLALLPATA